MSATIGKNDIKLSVFGRGFEDERTDSGEGVKDESEVLQFGANYAVFDQTGTYAWIRSTGYNHGAGLYKFNISNWSEVSHTMETDIYVLLQPNNVPSNLGVAIKYDGYCYVFDLTDDTIVCEGQFLDYGWSFKDCILVGNTLWLCTCQQGRAGNEIFHIDLDAQTGSKIQLTNSAFCGFVSDDIIYRFYPAEWFFQNSVMYGTYKDGTDDWSKTIIRGQDEFDLAGFGRNGYLCLPVKLYGAWRFGVYNANTAPTISKPIRTFGKFQTVPSFGWNVVYSPERKKAFLGTGQGLIVTDFTDCEKLSTEVEIPIGASDKVLLCSDSAVRTIKIHTL